jgi:hypothetical protein
MQSGDESYIVFVLNLVTESVEQLPICVVHKHDYSWANWTSRHKHLLLLLQVVLLEMINELSHCNVLIIKIDINLLFIIKEELHATTIKGYEIRNFT